MPENTLLKRPAAGQNAVVPVGPDARLEFVFNQGDAELGRDGQNLVLSFEDGGKLVLEGFYDNFGEGKIPPVLIAQGAELPGEAFLAALNNPDLMPLAGPVAAASPLGGGVYEEALMAGVGGVDGLDKLEFDAWAAPAEFPEAPVSAGLVPETPAGEFSLNAVSGGAGGGAKDMIAVAAIHEDWLPRQHEGDFGMDKRLFGRLDFDFTSAGTTVVDNIHLSGFDAGSVIVVGTPLFDADGRLVNGRPVSGRGQTLTFDEADFERGVYVLPPANSDGDMRIQAALDLRAVSSGRTATVNGDFTIIVDAVADKPEIVGKIDDIVLAGDDYAGRMNITEGKAQDYADGMAADIIHKNGMDVDADSASVALNAHFTARIEFGDFRSGDPSEKHYALIEAPSEKNADGAPGARGSWKIVPDSLDGELLDAGRITLWFDANDRPLYEGAVLPEEFAEQGLESREFFRIEVTDAYLEAHGHVVDASARGERVEAEIRIDLQGSFDGKGLLDAATFDLKAGAQAAENPGDRESAADNNVSYSFQKDTVALVVDTVDSTLTVAAGWAYEGNDRNKNIPDGGVQGHDWTAQAVAAGATDANFGVSTGDGAPVRLSIDGAGEHITGVIINFGSDADLRLGDLSISGDGYLASVDGWNIAAAVKDGVTTVSFTADGGAKTALDPANLNFIPKNAHEDADISFSYTVDVEAESGAKARYSGSSTAAVDAVADLAAEMAAAADAPLDSHIGAAVTVDSSDGVGDGIADRHNGPGAGAAGWETDAFRLNYSDAEYGFKLHVKAEFTDTDDSEKHYVLVEKPDNWNIVSLPEGLEWADAGNHAVTHDGRAYWKLEVTTAGGAPSIDAEIPMLRDKGLAGDETITIKTIAITEEQLRGDAHGHDSGREYDGQNDISYREGAAAAHTVDVLNSTLTVRAGWASEGGDDSKHLAGRAYDVSRSTSAGYTEFRRGGALGDPDARNYADSTGRAGSMHDGEAPIVFSLAGGAGSAEVITSVTLSLPDGRGVLVDEAGAVIPGDNGRYVVTDVDAGELRLWFRPAESGEQAYNYGDVNLQYTVTAKNVSGPERSFSGSSQIVIDAVADKPDASPRHIPAGDGRNVDYPHALHNEAFDRGKAESGDNPKFIEQTAAKPGDEVTVHGTVSFDDVSGGEDHFILIETGGNGDDYTLNSVRITDAGGKSITVDIDAAFMAAHSPVVIGSGAGATSCYALPLSELHPVGAQSGEYTLDITVHTSGTNQTNHINTIAFGGRSEAPHAGDPGGESSPNYEFDQANNVSNTLSSVTVETKVVNTAILTMNATRAYENADCNAHLGDGQNQSAYGGTVNAGRGDTGAGFVSRADMIDGSGRFTPEYLAHAQEDSSKISFSGLHSQDSISALCVRFQCLKDDAGADMLNTAGFMYADTPIPVNTGDDGLMMPNGDMAYCSYSAGWVTLQIIPAGGVYGTQTPLYLVPGETFRSDDIPLESAALIKNSLSGYTKGFGDNTLTGDLIARLEAASVLDRTADVQSGQNGAVDGDAKVRVDAVAQQAGVEAANHDYDGDGSMDGAVLSTYGELDGDGDGRTDGYAAGSYSGEYNHIAPGTTARVLVDIDLRGDVNDKSEQHLLLVRAPEGFELTGGAFTYYGVDGETHTADIAGISLLPVNAGYGGAEGGTYFAWDFANLDPQPMANQTFEDVALLIRTPAELENGTETHIEVGVRSQEEIQKIQSGQEWEGENANNQANSFEQIPLYFDASTRATASAGTRPVFENSDRDAHYLPGMGETLDGDFGDYKSGMEEYSVPLDFSFGDEHDAVDAFTLSLNNPELGDLYIFGSEAAYQSYLAAAAAPGANPYELIDDFGENMGANADLDAMTAVYPNVFGDPGGYDPKSGHPFADGFTGKIVFMPKADSYSGQDVSVNWSVRNHDTLSGQPGGGGGKLDIAVDAVAQRPYGAAVSENRDEGERTLTLNAGTDEEETIVCDHRLTVSATFVDTDGSTDHFVLVEAENGWKAFARDAGGNLREFGPQDTVSFKEDGPSYFKIPAEFAAGAAGNHAEGGAEVWLKAPTAPMFILDDSSLPGTYSIEVKVGSQDRDTADNELSYHNNTAVVLAAGDPIGGSYGGGGHVFEGPFRQDKPCYEDNNSLQDKGGASDAPGHFQLRDDWLDTAYTFTVELVDGEPALDVGGQGVTFENGVDAEGVPVRIYTVRVDQNHGQGIEVRLGGAQADSDADQAFRLVTVERSGVQIESYSGVRVAVDAAADMPLAVAGHSDYFNPNHDPGLGAQRIGGEDLEEYGETDAIAANKGDTARFSVHAEFGDIADRSEHHFILVEKTPAWDIPGAADVYVDGTAYYKVDVTGQLLDEPGKTDFIIEMTYRGGGLAEGASDQGVRNYTLKTGALSHEIALAVNPDPEGWEDIEFEAENNMSIVTGGQEVTLQYSPVDTKEITATLSPDNVDESGGEYAAQAVSLTIGGIEASLSDELQSFTISYDAALGTLYLNGETVASGDLSAEQIDYLNSGAAFTFKPNDFNHQDVDFNWAATVRDKVSGDFKSFTDSSKLVIDASADPGAAFGDNDPNTNPVTVVYDENGMYSAAVSNAPATVRVDADFTDNVSGSEKHWVVLEQADNAYDVIGAKIYAKNPDGGTGNPVEIDKSGLETKFDESGKPFYAVPMDDQGDYVVEFLVQTPERDEDFSMPMRAGVLVIDDTRNSDSNIELDYGDNWRMNLDSVRISTGMVESTTIRVTADAINEDGSSLLRFSLADAAPDGADSISQVSFRAPANGVISVGVSGNADYAEYASGQIVTVDAAYLDQVHFTPDKNLHNDNNAIMVQLTAGKLVDAASGATKDATGFVNCAVKIMAVDDAPAEITLLSAPAADAVGAGDTVVFTLGAKFPDYDGSERHYILVEARSEAWIEANPQYGNIFTDADGTKYFKIPATSNRTEDAQASVELNVPNTVGTSISLKTGALAEEQSADAVHAGAGGEYLGCAISGATVDLTLGNAAGLEFAPLYGATERSEGERLGFSLSLQNSAGESMVAAAAVSAVFLVTMPQTGEAADLNADLVFPAGADDNIVWTNQGNGAWEIRATLPAGASSLEVAFTALADGVIEHPEGLLVEYRGMSAVDGLNGLTAGNELLAAGSGFAFTIGDPDAAIAAAHGLGDEAVGMKLVRIDASHNHDGSAESDGQLVLGSDGDDAVVAGKGDDILEGGAGADSFVWNSDNMTGGLDAIMDFDQKAGDKLYFRDILGGDQSSLEMLLSSGSWDSETRTFSAGDQNGARIEFSLQADPLSLEQVVASLSVSCKDGTDASITHSQNVLLGNFSFEHGDGTVGNDINLLEQDEVVRMLSDIIKVTG